MRAALTWRVLGPLLAAAVALAVHEATRPALAPRATPAAAPVALPLPPAWRGPGAGRTLQLDGESSRACFCIEGAAGPITVAGPGLRGELTFGRDGAAAELLLELDLAEPAGLGAGTAPADVRRLLRPQDRGVVHYRARAVAITTFEIAGVQRVGWAGTLRLGSRVRQQAVDMWLTTLLPSTARMQGVGAVAGSDLGLRPRYFLGVLPEASEVTVALDLAWRLP